MWKHVPDNAVAWEYYEEGLLWYGNPTDEHSMYRYMHPELTWDKASFLEANFSGGINFLRNYILLED